VNWLFILCAFQGDPFAQVVSIMKYPNIVSYMRMEANRITDSSLSNVTTRAQWEAMRDSVRQKFLSSLGLNPMPARTPLNAQITGVIDTLAYTFTVQKLVFEALPKVYVTSNLYIPRNIAGKAPAILYLCGHANQAGGSKVYYQSHGIWYAEHGYICLVMDNLYSYELGPDQHHDVYNKKRLDLYSKGYTPGAAETWNAIRAIDYLYTRPDVDTSRIGATGRSGGGVMSWWITAVDDRIRCAVPEQGTITLKCSLDSLMMINENCDCNYHANINQLSFPMIYALAAPRPVLVLSGMHDEYYPPRGYSQLQSQLAKVYQLYGAISNFSYQEFDTTHFETDAMRAAAFRWFNQRFKNDSTPLAPVPKQTFFSSAQLKVYSSVPADQRTATLQEAFIQTSVPPAITSSSAWLVYKADLLQNLKRYCFYHTQIPSFSSLPLAKQQTEPLTNNGRYTTEGFTFQSELGYRTHARLRIPATRAPIFATYVYPNDHDFLVNARMETHMVSLLDSGCAVLDVDQRGAISLCDAPSAPWNPTEEWYVLRSLHAIGKSPVAMGVVDLLRAMQVLRTDSRIDTSNLRVLGCGKSGVVALYAAALDERIREAVLDSIPCSHADPATNRAPFLLNVLRYADLPQIAALLAPRPFILSNVDRAAFSWTRSIYSILGTTIKGYFAMSAFDAKVSGHFGATSLGGMRARIFYSLHANTRVKLQITDPLGKAIRTLVNSRQESGGYEVQWDGTDDRARPVASGLYLCRIKAGEFTGAREITVAK